MKTCLQITLLLALVMATAVSAAQVTSINLAHETGAAVLRIDLQGPFQFTHMAEVPKDGKPDRLIVDIVGATHNWGPKEWATLPQCGVSKLRIGQYSSKPEKIVRVVLELPKAPVYQADSDGKSIKIRLTDSSIKPFAAWTTGPAPATAPVVPVAPVKPQATTAPTTATATQPTTPTVAAAPKPVLSKPADSPTSHSTLVQKPATPPTTTAPAPAAKPAPTVATNDSKPAQSTASPVKPTELLKPSTSSAPVVATQTTKPSADAKPVTPTVAQTAPATKPTAPAVKAPAVPATAPAAKSEQLAKVDQFKPQTSPATPVEHAAKPAAPTVAATSPAVTTAPLVKPAESKEAAPAKSDEMTAKPKAPEKPLLAEADDAAGSSTPARQTARFRRSASASAKMKSSLVAEFPQRLVIKYENLGYRDPFATLIDDSRTYDTPFEKRLANVEGLRLVGILESGTGDDRALFQDKRNFSYLLKAGDKVEKGYVLRVEKEKVYFQIFEYGWSRTVALTFENRN